MLNILRNASDVVVVPAPDEPVTAIIGCFADMTTLPYRSLNCCDNYIMEIASVTDLTNLLRRWGHRCARTKAMRSIIVKGVC
jgi:hypothetical protein